MYLYFDLIFYLKNPLESKCLKFLFNAFIRTFANWKDCCSGIEHIKS